MPNKSLHSVAEVLGFGALHRLVEEKIPLTLLNFLLHYYSVVWRDIMRLKDKEFN